MKLLVATTLLSLVALAKPEGTTRNLAGGGQGQGQGNGPPEDPGTTTTTKDIFLFAPVDYDSDYCYDRDYLCDSFWSNYNDNEYDTPYASATAYAGRRVLCRLTAYASSYLSSYVLASGSMTMAQHGNNGAVHTIDLSVDVDSSTYMSVYSSTTASADTSSYGSARTYSNVRELCNYLYTRSYPPYLYTYYGCSDSSASSSAYTSARADSFGSAYARAGLSTGNDYSSSVVVEGKNLQNFTASVNVGASGYAYSSASSSADAYASAYSSAYSNSFNEVCRKVFQRYCTYWGYCYTRTWDQFCNDARAYASSYASAYGSAYASARSSAYANFNFDALVTANFVRTPGVGDELNLAGEIDDGYSYSYASAYCRA